MEPRGEIPFNLDEVLTILPEDIPLSLVDQEIDQVAEAAQADALVRLKNASNLTDYLRWQQAASFLFRSESIAWAWEYGGITAAELIAKQESPDFTERYQKHAQYAEQLKPNLEYLPVQSDQIRICLKRIRDRDTGYFSYVVIAAYPPESQVYDPLDRGPLSPEQLATDSTFFMVPETACVSHACDDLYKKYGSTFYIPHKTYDQLQADLKPNNNNVIEYVIEKNDTGVVKQDAADQLQFGLIGGYSNETFRLRISDFWNRQ